MGFNSEHIVKPNKRERKLVLPQELSLLPIKDAVMFPQSVLPVLVNKPSSMRLIDDVVVAQNRMIAISTLIDPSIEEPKFDDVYSIGVVATIHTMLRLTDHQKLIIQGLKRIRFVECLQEKPYIRVRVEELPDVVDWSSSDEMEMEALKRNIVSEFQKMVSLSQNIPEEFFNLIAGTHAPSVLADTVSLHLPISNEEKQELLSIQGIRERLHKVLSLLTREVDVLELGSKIQSQVNSELGKVQREYYLREQLKAIRRELGEGDDRTEERDELRKKILHAHMPEEAEKEALKELKRLSNISTASPEYSVSRTYIDNLLALPWNTYTVDNMDITDVHRVLDEDHYGLEKVKERILEYLSVRKFKNDNEMRHPILCFVGPPGVGKTSLGRSIARALGRKFVRMSLGGVHDEAEIRGHRKTYIGAMPGQIIQHIKRAGTNNPIFMLDEIDKVGSDHRGDPSSALLEVLDPEQNSTFRDNYLEVSFDLSKVMFITTANMLDTIPPPLRDRMEILQLSGYTEEEKLEIAKRHLVPKQLKEHGLLKSKHLTFNKSGLTEIIRGYTREAGVRNLERQIAAICRKVAREFAEGRGKLVRVGSTIVHKYLGVPRYITEEIAGRTSEPGVCIGLAWTPVGGDILFIEASVMPGSGRLVLTGQLGNVMKESAQAAMSYIKSNAHKLGVKNDVFKENDIHLHVPAGAIPKDGPSAGVTIATAIVSLLTKRVIRPYLAMTGEITLRGKVLPVGGIKEKILAANRVGVNTIIVPKRNKKDVEEDIPADILKKLTICYVENISEVLKVALKNNE